MSMRLMDKKFKLLETGVKGSTGVNDQGQPSSQNEDGVVRFAMTLVVPVNCFDRDYVTQRESVRAGAAQVGPQHQAIFRNI